MVGFEFSKFKTFSFWENKYYLALLFTVLFILYLPVLTGYYLWHDDFNAFIWNKSNIFGHPIYEYLKVLGRPVGALVLIVFIYPVDTIGDGSWVRALLLSFTIIAAYLLFLAILQILKAFKIKSIYSLPEKSAYLLLVAFIFSLPPFTTYVAYISNGMVIIAFIVGITGSICLVNFLCALPGKFRFLIFTLFIGCSLLSLLIYPPPAMAIFCLLGLLVLSASYEDMQAQWKGFLKISLLACAPVVIYACYLKFFLSPVEGVYKLNFESDLWFKVQWMYEAYLLSFNFWNIFPGYFLPKVFAVLIALGFLIELAKELKSSDKNQFAKKTGFVIFKYLTLFLLSIATVAPNFFSEHGRSLFYRVSLVLFAFSAILVFFSLRNILWALLRESYAKRVFLLLLFLTCGVSFYNANKNINYIAESASIELRYIKSQLLKHDLTQVKRIHLIRPFGPSVSLTAPHSRSDEFAMPITGAPQYANGIMLAMLKETGVKIDHLAHRSWGYEINQWKVSNSTQEEMTRLEFPEPTLFIDMNTLNHFY